MNNDIEIMEDEIVIAVKDNNLPSLKNLMNSIRTEWKGKNLIQRVEKLLPIDPSSACQKILNASIHDLKQKILIAGLDIANEVAKRFHLPIPDKSETIENAYSVTHIIDLSYRMGLLSRQEWRRIRRCYDIRKDLEHEDDEYEATPEDCIYIFKTCIEVILSRDPIELIKTSDVEEKINSSEKATLSTDFMESFCTSPDPRQFEIINLLIAVSLDSKKTDVVRQNSMELLRSFNSITRSTVKIKIAEEFQQKIKNKDIDLTTAKVMYASGIFPYLKQNKRLDFFCKFLERFKTTGFSWRNNKDHEKLFDDFEDIGALKYCPDDLREHFILWLTLCYIGEPGGYGRGHNRSVFYSDTVAYRIVEIFKNNKEDVLPCFTILLGKKDVSLLIKNGDIKKRADHLLQILS